ncbi:MAG: hypothetical protein RLZZ337_888 [Bacteroidota bacterium]
MKKLLHIAWIASALLIIGVLITRFTIDARPNTYEQVLDISSFVDKLEQESEQIFDAILPVAFNTSNAQKAMELADKKWYLITLENGYEVFWNSNKINLDTTLLQSSEFPCFYSFGDDVYTVFKRDERNYLLFRIANDGLLSSRLVKAYPRLDRFKLVVDKETENPWEIAPLVFAYQGNQFTTTLWFSLLASAILFFLALLYLKNNSRFIALPVVVLVGLNLLVLRLSPYAKEDFYLMRSTAFFALDETKALLLLCIHLLTLAGFVFTAVYYLKRISRDWAILPLVIILVFASDITIDLAENIIRRSTISFDFVKLFGLTFHTFAALTYICISFILLWSLIQFSRINRRVHRRKFWTYAIIGCLFFIVFQVVDANRSIYSLVWPIIVLALSFAILHYIDNQKRKIYLHFVLTAVLTSLLVFVSQRGREQIYVRKYAQQLIENKDLRAEIILKSIENQLAQEFLVPEDYENFIQRKDIIENRIKRLYFSNYLEKYELKLFSFDSAGLNVNQNALYTYEDLDHVYNKNTRRTESNYFYQIDNPASFNGYIGKYENCDLQGHNGTTFILLQPRVVQSEFLYPEVFANQQSREVVSLQDYSYGIYFKNRLISQRGSFPYQLNIVPKQNRFNLWGYHHKMFEERGFMVVLSKKENLLASWMSSFTITILLLLPISFFISLCARGIFGAEHALSIAFLPGSNKYLSSRIQTSLTIILLSGLLLSVYIIISYIRTNYNQNLENQLLVKVKNIGSQFQNQVDLKKKLQDEEQRRLMLNEESSTYNVDINLFDEQGRLLSSTKPYLLENEILGEMMNPIAFTKLTLNQNSQLLIHEELEGSDYLSAYVPLFDGKNRVIGYLNTPYFAKNEELNKQISSLVVNVLNIYFLLLLVAVFIAIIISRQIAKPLLLIQEKIAKTELRGSNELIVYDRDDEIGQLVKQYNKMVLELEESADQLAENEREDAWREMAKQVAHEIKNPLTPMKLSLQHLQRAYANGPSEKLDGLFKKTSVLLIDQINSLSNMASEFSNFAQMPEDKFTKFNLSEVLENTSELFVRSENVAIKTVVDPNIWVYADVEQIKRVLNNLIKNAIQAIPEGRKGKIEVSLKIIRKMARIRVKDNGTGIPESLYKKVFVPNFSTKNSGMGLGLAICKKIVESAKGNISFISELDKGTTFEVNLPISDKV